VILYERKACVSIQIDFSGAYCPYSSTRKFNLYEQIPVAQCGYMLLHNKLALTMVLWFQVPRKLLRLSCQCLECCSFALPGGSKFDISAFPADLTIMEADVLDNGIKVQSLLLNVKATTRCINLNFAKCTYCSVVIGHVFIPHTEFVSLNKTAFVTPSIWLLFLAGYKPVISPVNGSCSAI